MIEVRLTRKLHEAILSDLDRPHAFATERVGFAVGRCALGSEGSILILLSSYAPVADDHYLIDPTVGARIGTDALTAASHLVYHGRQSAEGVFHVHLHGHHGEPAMSGTDACELPSLIPGFRSVGPAAPHGILIWSLDHGAVWVWLPESSEPTRADKISIIGAPLSVMQARSKK
jgi:hypothetical protein